MSRIVTALEAIQTNIFVANITKMHHQLIIGG